MTEEEILKMYLDAGLEPYSKQISEAKKYEHEYYDVLHVCCPKCGGKDYCSTLVGYIMNPNNFDNFKDRNEIRCNCGWVGITHDLVEKKEKPTL